MAAPPYCSGTVMPSTPSSPILRHRSIGNRSLASISAARGAISAAAKARTASRSASMSSPSWKSSPGRFMVLSSMLDVAADDGHHRGRHGGDQLLLARAVELQRAAVDDADGAPRLDDLALEAKARPPGRRQQVDLELDRQHRRIGRHQAERGIAAG